MKLKDHIAYLQTLDPELECWLTWDESGECWPCTTNQGEIWFVGQEDILENGRVRYYEHTGTSIKDSDKKVFMINA